MRAVRLLPAVLLVMALVLMAGGCTQKMREAFKGMFALQQAIQKEFGVKEVAVNIVSNSQGTALTVSFVNSALNDLSEAERSLKAREVADFVSRSYGDYGSLTRINVAFVVRKDYFLLHFTNTVRVYSFDVPITATETETI